MTKAELLVDLKNMIGPGNSIENSGLLNWINDAYMYMIDEITKENPDYFSKSATTSTISGDREYSTPDDFEKVLKVEIQLDGTWHRAQMLPPNANIGSLLETSSGNSNGYSYSNISYYVNKEKIGFEPIPQETTDSNIKLWYVYTPAELSEDDDEPDFPKKYHHIIKYGAYATFLDHDEEHVSAENMRIRFEKRVRDMVDNLGQNSVDESKSVVITSNQGLYYDEDYV